MKEIGAIARHAEKYAKQLQVNSDIHLDDFIFKFLIENQSFDSIESAVKYYFYDAKKSVDQLNQLLQEIFRNRSRPLSMLEFASGYGCVTRHLLLEGKNIQSVACDIHANAVEFIRKNLGGEALLSCDNPKDFKLQNQYDIVFALSFFSHMPKKTWSDWLVSLFNAVSPGGALIFTTQGLKSAKFFGDPKLGSDGFWFLADSEQKDLDFATYGQTIVTEKFVVEQIKSCLNADPTFIMEGFWWGHQDCYVIKKPELKD